MTAALITGASRGIGRAIALRLAGMGYDVFLLARNASALDETVQACRALGVQAGCLAGDLSDEAYMDAAMRDARSTLGEVGVLINNAGTAAGQAVQQADTQAWKTVMDLNFTAVVYLCRHLLPEMIERQTGAIINISSISGRNTDAGSGIYSATKHALNGLSGCMFEDVRDYGIKVSTLMPGFVDTDLTQGLGLNPDHMIGADDVADAVQYVLSASARVCPTEIVLRPQLRPGR